MTAVVAQFVADVGAGDILVGGYEGEELARFAREHHGLLCDLIRAALRVCEESGYTDFVASEEASTMVVGVGARFGVLEKRAGKWSLLGPSGTEPLKWADEKEAARFCAWWRSRPPGSGP